MMDEKSAGTAREVANQQLDTLEERADGAVDTTKETIHEPRNEAESLINQALARVEQVWKQQQPKARALYGHTPVAGARRFLAGRLPDRWIQ
jgi:hypothetical protein